MKIMKQFLYCLVIFSPFLNTVFRKAKNTTNQYKKVKFDLKQGLWRHPPRNVTDAV